MISKIAEYYGCSVAHESGATLQRVGEILAEDGIVMAYLDGEGN